MDLHRCAPWQSGVGLFRVVEMKAVEGFELSMLDVLLPEYQVLNLAVSGWSKATASSPTRSGTT